MLASLMIRTAFLDPKVKCRLTPPVNYGVLVFS